MSDYLFQGRTYAETDRLAAAMAEAWEEGKKELFSGSIRSFAQQSARDLYYLSLAAENSRKKTPEREDVIYFRWLYKAASLKSLYWKGVCYGTPGEVAGLLAAGTSPVLDQAVRLLARSGLFSLFLASAGAKEEQVRKTEFAEKLLRRRGKGIQEESIPFVLSGILSENKEFAFDGTSFSSVPELAARLQTYADRSPELLEKKCAGLYTAEGTLIPAFLVWMIVQGQEKALLSWHSRFHPAEESGQGEEPTLAEEGEDMPPADLQTGFIPTLKRPDPAFFLDLPGT